MTPLQQLGTDILDPDKKWEDMLKEWVEEPDEWDRECQDDIYD